MPQRVHRGGGAMMMPVLLVALVFAVTETLATSPPVLTKEVSTSSSSSTSASSSTSSSSSETPLNPHELGSRLEISSKVGNLTRVKELVSQGADVNYGGGLPLIEATENGHTEIVRFLLQSGANANTSNDNPYNYGRALLAAAKNNYLEIVNLLLDADASVVGSEIHNSPLEEAAKNGHYEVVQRLLEAGADPDGKYGFPLRNAADKGYLSIVEALIAAGANISLNNGAAAWNAALEGHLAVVQTIVESGLKPQYYGDVLEMATAGNHMDIVRYAVGLGANPSHDSIWRQAAEGGNLEMVKYLVASGSNLTEEDEVLWYATDSKNPEVVRFLLESGANLTCIEGGVICPWHNAARVGSPEIISLFVEFGADINRAVTEDKVRVLHSSLFEDVNGSTVMHISAKNGYPMANVLQDLGADINARDTRGRTPLQIAVQNEKFIVAKGLLQLCADLAPVTNEGKTALDLAKDLALTTAPTYSQYPEVKSFLQEVIPHRIADTPYNDEAMENLRDEVLSALETNSTFIVKLGDQEVPSSYTVYWSIKHLLRERAWREMVDLIEDHKCKGTLLDSDAVAMGTDYLFRCDCIPGQGSKLTMTLLRDAPQCAPVS